MICRACRVSVARASNGRWVHTDLLPEGTDAHEAEAVDPQEETVSDADRATLDQVRGARERVSKMRETMRDPRFGGVVWSDIARDAVALLDRIETLEREIANTFGDYV